jgi:Plasmid pRiA4b ORF-3-like protein
MNGTAAMAKTANPKVRADQAIISLKVTLRGTKPPIWRRLLMPGAMTLGDLHQAIQAAMGWEDCHLHAFEIADRRYGEPGTVDDVADEERLTLSRCVKSGVVRFTYTYDFGDDWEHAVVIEKSQLLLEGGRYPACVAGKRNCPPEDCGGPWGYQDLLDILADPAHPEYADRMEWLGEAHDPEEFSLEAADARVATRFKPKPKGKR